MPPLGRFGFAQPPAGQRMADTSISGARVARELDALVRVYVKPVSIVSERGFVRHWSEDNDERDEVHKLCDPEVGGR